MIRPLALVIALAVPIAAAAEERAAPTFARDVAPIVFRACVSCHRAGGPGPFPLTAYREVRQRARLRLPQNRRKHGEHVLVCRAQGLEPLPQLLAVGDLAQRADRLQG